MRLIPQPSLVDQAYEAILGEIADGTLAPNAHLIQEILAAQYGVSRHPIQQALLLLKADGVVQDAGRRGLVVAPLDLQMMRDRYQVRAALDGLAARLAAQRCSASPEIAECTRRDGERIIAAGLGAVADGAIKPMIAHDVAFHAFVYGASGNPMIGPTAEVHWRFLRRVMGEVLRKSEPPHGIWLQHREILDAIVAGDVEAAEVNIRNHIASAASRLVDTTQRTKNQGQGHERSSENRRSTAAGHNRRQ